MGIKSIVNKSFLVIRRNAPTICTFTSIGLGISAVGFGIKETPKAINIVNNFKEQRALIYEEKDIVAKENENLPEGEEAKTYNAASKLLKLYLSTGGKLVYNYLGAELCLAGSIGTNIASRQISAYRLQKKTEEAAASAYALAQLKQKIEEKLSPEQAAEILDKKIEKVTNPETGKEETVIMNNKDNDSLDIWYNETCKEFDPLNMSLNIDWLEGAEDYWNDRLRSEGVVWLDQIYRHIKVDVDCIGKKQMEKAHRYGWVYNPKDPKANNYISFGIREPYENCLTRDAKYAKMHNMDALLLKFNCVDIINNDYTKYYK